MRVGKSGPEEARREEARRGQTEEKFNLETQSSKLPKEVHAPCIHRKAGRDDFSRGKFHPVPSPIRLPTPPPSSLLILTPKLKVGPLILSIAPSQAKNPLTNYKIDLIHSLTHSLSRRLARSRKAASVKRPAAAASGKVALDGPCARSVGRGRSVGLWAHVLFIRPLCMDMVVHK